MDNLNNLNHDDLMKHFIQACKNGDIQDVQYILDYTSLKESDSFFKCYENGFNEASCLGQLEIVKYLLQYPYFQKIQYDDNVALIYACQNGHLDIVKFLLTSDDEKIKQHFNNKLEIGLGLVYASRGGQIEVIKYLLTSNELEHNADIHHGNDNALINAGSMDNLETIKYLLTSPDLKEHANIHAQNDKIFKFSLESENFDILRYLIFDLHIEQTENIKNHLKRINNEEVINWFNIRKLNNDLSSELFIKETIGKKNKI